MRNIVVRRFIHPTFLSKTCNQLLLVFAFIFLVGTLEAQTVVTTGSGNWSSTVPNAPWPGGTIPGAGADIVVGNGFTLTVDGARTCNSLSDNNSSTVNVNAALTITSNLSIGNGTIFNANNTLSVGGTTTVASSGVISVGTPGTKLFVGLVTINSGGSWSNAAEPVVFRGGITNNGSFSAGTAVQTFNTNSQTLTGSFTIPSVTVTGGTVVLTNTSSLTVGTALSGTGRLTQGAGATLNIGGTSTITNMTATAAGNTVNYTGAAQTVHSNAYENLGLSGSGVKTLQAGTTSITGDLTLSGSASTTGVIGLTIGDDVIIGSGTSFTTGAFTHNIAGDFTNNGTFDGTGSTVILNGVAQNITGGSTTFNHLTLSGSGTKTFGVNPTLAIAGTLLINNGVVANLSNTNTQTANSLYLGGAIQPAGSWGSSSSSALPAFQNNTFFSGNGVVTIATGAFSYYSIASTAWNLNTTWSNTGFGGAAAAGTPGVGDYVYIGGGRSVTISGAETCSALFFDAGAGDNTLTISSGSLTVSGAVTIPQATSGSNILDVGAGTLTASSVAFTSTPAGTNHRLSISSGTATISGNITGIGASSTIQFTGAGLLQVGGSMFSAANGTLTSFAGSTVEYTGAAQTVQALGYNNLRLSGSGTKTQAAATTVGGNLTIGDGVTFNIGAFNFTVTGTTTVGGGTSGTLSLTSATGTKTFTGLVTIATGATWTNTTEAITFQGGITNNGTFTSGSGVHTFSTNSQALTGTFSIQNVTVTGAAVVLINNNTLTATTTLAGTGRLTQGAGATLNIGGTSTITNMTATAAGNTVNYTGAAQTVHNNAYENLELSGSGVKTLQAGTTAITGDLTLSGTSASATAVVGLTIGDDVIIASGNSFTTGAFTHNIAGDFTNNGTFTGTGSTIVLNGTAQNITGGSTTFNNLTLSGSGTKTFGVSPTLAITGTLTINNGTIAGLDNANTHTSNALILGGAIQLAGTWGSSSSAAANQNNTFFSGTGLVSVTTGANTYYSIASTAWNLNTTWSNAGFGGAAASGTPTAADFVYIGDNRAVTITGAETCAALFFDPGTAVNNSLTISSGSLTVSGAVTIPQTATSGSNTLNVGSGTLSAASIAFTSTPSGAGHQLTISTGTATVSGNISGIGASSTIAFSGAGLLRVGGSMFSAANGTLTPSTGTVEYTGAAQTVQALTYNHLGLSGSGTKTMAANTTIGGNLVIGDGVTFNVGAFNLTVTGTTTVGGGTNGTLSITSATGTKTFIGLVTIASGAAWTNTTEAVTLRGGITNNGTFTAGTGVYTFNTNSQVLTGTLSIPSVTVTGASVVLTNTNTLTVGTALGGTGRITQGTGATLNIGGTSTIANMTATASGNTVNYTGAAQTVHSNAYENLGLSGSGVKTLQAGTTVIAGDLTLSGTASVTGVANLTIGRDLTIGSGTTFTSGAFDHIIGRHWINNGTFNHSSRRITFTGSTTQNIQGTSVTTFYDLRISNGTANPDVQLDQTAGVNLIGEMTFANDAVFDADGPAGNMVFTVISTAGTDGRIGQLGGTADVTGSVTVQRYMDAEGKIYRYISSPVDNPTAQDLQGEIPITGPFTGSSFPPQTGCTSCAPCTGCVLNNTSMYQYDESIVAGVNSRYKAFPSNGGINTETMLPGKGYAVFVRNDVSPTTWDLRAPLNKGEVDLDPSITGSNDGFNLVGNPYASPIDWESGAWTRNAGIDPTIYIWDNSINNYASYTLGGASTNGGSRYIATGQAFWVLASGSPDLRAQEGIKASQASALHPTFFRKTNPLDNLRMKLIADNGSDEVLIKLNETGTTENFDVRIDAAEFPSDTLLSLHSITAENKRLAINVMGPQSKESTEIMLGLAGVKQGTYSIDFVEFQNFSVQTNVYLLDRFNDNNLVEILPTKSRYSFEVTLDPKSFGSDRFVVYLTRNGEKPEVYNNFESNVSVYPNPTTDKVEVRVKSQERVSAQLFNTLGTQVVDPIELVKMGGEKAGQFDLRSLASGVYIIQIQSGGNKFNLRILKK